MIKNKVAVIYMGGTFGCVGQPLAPMPASEFLSRLDFFSKQQSLDCVDLKFFAAPVIRDSSELNAGDWLHLAFLIKKIAIAEQIQHIVIIHGTDTLSYAAAFLHHIFAQQMTVILTASQYPLLDHDGENLSVSSDAWQNFLFSIQQLRQLPTGVYIGFAHQVLAADSSYKCHTTALQAFYAMEQQLPCGQSLACLAQLNPQHIDDIRKIKILNYYLYPSVVEHVEQLLTISKDNLPHILILQAFGSGNLVFSIRLQQLLTDLLMQGCWVIMSSQVLFGPLSSHYLAGSWLSEVGVVFDPHFSQADTYARATLLYLQYGHEKNWQKYWI